MFTGIITDIGTVVDKSTKGDFVTLDVSSGFDAQSIDIGASIAHAGVCLTVTTCNATDNGCVYTVDISPETLEKTTSRYWEAGAKLNLERAMKAGDEFGGHIVSGHVDGVTDVLERRDMDQGAYFKVASPSDLRPFIANKGSVTLDGTSLTVNGIGEDYFELMLIPHTLEVTTWKEIKAGSNLNLEVDTFARYVARYVDHALSQKGLVAN